MERANTVVKDKIAKWQAVNCTSDWVDSLTEMCYTINDQTHEFLPASVTLMQFMFLRKLKSSTSYTLFTIEKKRQVLRQISIEDINSLCEQTKHKKGKRGKSGFIAK